MITLLLLGCQSAGVRLTTVSLGEETGDSASDSGDSSSPDTGTDTADSGGDDTGEVETDTGDDTSVKDDTAADSGADTAVDTGTDTATDSGEDTASEEPYVCPTGLVRFETLHAACVGGVIQVSYQLGGEPAWVFGVIINELPTFAYFDTTSGTPMPANPCCEDGTSINDGGAVECDLYNWGGVIGVGEGAHATDRYSFGPLASWFPDYIEFPDAGEVTCIP